MSGHLLLSAPFAAVYRHQFSLFHIKLLFLAHLPFMEPMLAHTFTRRFFNGFLEGENIGHGFL
ncbi:hypothetical protein Y5S_00688 [Alcanivorax nanhaiticus]|uniref:Uncharacterized protein n=1 Tax=Alcanivorax nanhaiticus TaxID=1177154 RepID=A0A095SNH7_9GAMM|nr:hypothetical protein Y5S_00688 [Alcanivorax nanhaiticus]